MEYPPNNEMIITFIVQTNLNMSEFVSENKNMKWKTNKRKVLMHVYLFSTISNIWLFTVICRHILTFCTAQGDQIQTHQMWDKEYACGGQCGTQRTLTADTQNNNYRYTNKNGTTELLLNLSVFTSTKDKLLVKKSILQTLITNRRQELTFSPG